MDLASVPNIKAMLVFLAGLGCQPNPTVEYDADLAWPGLYRDGVMYLRSEATPARVIVHELVHACQEPARSRQEWLQNEIQAHHIEQLWMIRQADQENH